MIGVAFYYVCLLHYFLGLLKVKLPYDHACCVCMPLFPYSFPLFSLKSEKFYFHPPIGALISLSSILLAIVKAKIPRNKSETGNSLQAESGNIFRK